jgi:hypothetical protein
MTQWMSVIQRSEKSNIFVSAPVYTYAAEVGVLTAKDEHYFFHKLFYIDVYISAAISN